MLRLGASQWWLGVEPGGEAWALYRVVGGKRPRTLREGGRLTSPKHALQVLERMPRSRKVPKGAIESLRDLVVALEAGDLLAEEMPGEPSESSGAAGDGDSRTEPQPPEDDDEGSE